MQKRQQRKSNEPSTAGGRELRLKARPPARFSSLRSTGKVNQKQEPSGNTLLAQRYPLSGNSYFWRKGTGCSVPATMASSAAAKATRRRDLVNGRHFICFRVFITNIFIISFLSNLLLLHKIYLMFTHEEYY
jgi:hypothetical protein